MMCRLLSYWLSLWCLVLPVDGNTQVRFPFVQRELKLTFTRQLRIPLRADIGAAYASGTAVERAVARVQTSCRVPEICKPLRTPFLSPRGPFPGKAKIDAVIFDLDGTLLNSLGAWEHSGSNFVRSRGFEPPAELDDELVALSLLDGARLIKERYGLAESPEEILAQTLAPIKEHYYRDIMPMPGVPETLARLKRQGVKMVVATASDRDLAEVSLRRLGLLDYFDFIIKCDEVGVGKKSPAVYQEALRRLGTPQARTLVVEDALHALQTAQQAGFPTAAVEEAHSAQQQARKQQISDYYIFSYQGNNVISRRGT